MTMRVVVTGAAGFIGSHVAEALLGRGWTVLGLDNLNDYYDPAQKRRNRASVTAAGGEVRAVDVRDVDALDEAFRGFRPDRVIHLAAMAGVRNSIEHPRLYTDTNVVGTQNVLEAARTCDVDLVVLASTSSVYGDTTRIPFSEDDPAVRPLQPYAASKRAAELLASTYHHVYGLPSTVVRFFTVYGPRGRPDMMPFLLVDSIRSGRTIPYYGDHFARDWTFISDVVEGVVAAVDRPMGFEVLNLGRGAPVSLGDFVAQVEATAGGRALLDHRPAPRSEMLTTYADVSKARDLLGYEPKVDIGAGVDALWTWFGSRPEG